MVSQLEKNSTAAVMQVARLEQFTQDFPAIFGATAAATKVKHNVEHFLVTTGPRVSSETSFMLYFEKHKTK
jgi:hypothetical protein